MSLFMSDMLFMGHVPLFSAPLLVSLVPLFLVCVVPFFPAHLSLFPIPVLVLSSSGNSASQEKRDGNSDDSCESLHDPSRKKLISTPMLRKRTAQLKVTG